ncbi:hypothetical protein BsWGS_15600 [Bradybaena similaris]
MRLYLHSRTDNAIQNKDHPDLPPLFIPIAITSIILGVIGNMCFCFFFGNSRTRIYKSRDALYFRRMALIDLIICGFVIPFSVFYESGFVNNRAVCKIMEFIEHVLIFTSHLVLAAYSFELPRRVSYVDVQINVTRMMCCSIMLACIFSLPTIFLYDVDKVYDRKSESWIVKTCHLVISDDYGSVNLLRIHYYAVMCLCYIMALAIFIFKAMHYCDHLSIPGRHSLSVQLMERAQMSQLKTFSNDTWRHRVRRHSQTGRPIVFAEYIPEDVSREASLEISNAGQKDNAPAAVSQPEGSEDIVISASSALEDSEDSTLSDVSGGDKKNERSLQRKDSLTLPPITSSGRLREHSVIRKSSTSKKRETIFMTNSEESIPPTLFNCLLRWLCCEIDTKQSILKQNSLKGQLRIESYKQQFMSLILMDFIIIFAAAALYLTLQQKGVILNLIHTKSIISFYLVSLSHPGLRMVLRKHISYYCLRTLKGEDLRSSRRT